MSSILLSANSIAFSVLVTFASYMLVYSVGAERVFKSEVSTKYRYEYLDSLRGVAALLVFIHHSIYVFNFHNMGTYSHKGIFTHSSQFMTSLYANFGAGSVMIFFMITGFLFFDKLLRADGPDDYRVFYIKRIRRLLPLMLACLLFAVVVASIFGIGNLNARPADILKIIITWLSFGFFPLADISKSVPGWVMTAGVFWTLAIEWKFYVLVPFLSAVTKSSSKALLFILTSALVIFSLYELSLIEKKSMNIIFCFLFGFLSAVLVSEIKSDRVKIALKSPILALAAIAILMNFISRTSNPYTIKIVVSLFLVFILVVNGNSLFGLFKIKPIILAGKASYSIYVLHALVLNLVCWLLLGESYYLIFSVSAIILSILSILFYFQIEKRFMSYRIKE